MSRYPSKLIADRDAEIRRLRGRLARSDKKLAASRAENASMAALLAGLGAENPGGGNFWIDYCMRAREVLDLRIANEKLLFSLTVLSCERFHFLPGYFEPCLTGLMESPLSHRDAGRGNRSRLEPRHLLLMGLEKMKRNPAQAVMAATYGMDQSQISRLLAAVLSVLGEALPTAEKCTEAAEGAETEEELYEIIPGGIIRTDGTLTDSLRSGDPAVEKDKHSVRAWGPAHNTNVATNKRGEIVWHSKPHPGSRHDIHRIKLSECVKAVSEETLGEFGPVFSAATGLANLKLMFREIKAGRGVAYRVMERALCARERGA